MTVLSPNSFLEKKIGLLNHLSLQPDNGLLLRNVKAVHTFGMKFNIGVACIDANSRILKVVEIEPGLVFRGPRQTVHILEFHQSKIPEFNRIQGSLIDLVHINELEMSLS